MRDKGGWHGTGERVQQRHPSLPTEPMMFHAGEDNGLFAELLCVDPTIALQSGPLRILSRFDRFPS
jgi:hypothetical protein